MAYTRAKSFLSYVSTNEVKIPISGMITDLFVKTGTEVKQGVVLAILQAMKMEVEIHWCVFDIHLRVLRKMLIV
jgi:biotin carboxyl carrier protein